MTKDAVCRWIISSPRVGDWYSVYCTEWATTSVKLNLAPNVRPASCAYDVWTAASPIYVVEISRRPAQVSLHYRNHITQGQLWLRCWPAVWRGVLRHLCCPAPRFDLVFQEVFRHYVQHRLYDPLMKEYFAPRI